jgi:glucosamine kinase
MRMEQDVVIGIDGGGTHTRVMVCELTGRVLAYIEKGSASLHKDLQAQNNVKLAISEGLAAAGKEPHQVRGLAAGIAGYDSESDLEWVESLTALAGLTCPRWHVNDAVAAHYGALLMEPGIIAISGTGSIVVACTENGRYLRNFDFHQYAYSAARFISYEAVYEVLAGNVDETDSALVEAMLLHWGVESVAELYAIGAAGFDEDRRERDRRFGQFAPSLTDAAQRGSALAKRVCDRALHQLKIGIQLLGASFTRETIPVAFIGSVINSPYMCGRLETRLRASGGRHGYTIVPPRYSPAAGAVLYALRQVGIPIDDEVTANLDRSEFTRT